MSISPNSYNKAVTNRGNTPASLLGADWVDQNYLAPFIIRPLCQIVSFRNLLGIQHLEAEIAGDRAGAVVGMSGVEGVPLGWGAKAPTACSRRTMPGPIMSNISVPAT